MLHPNQLNELEQAREVMAALNESYTGAGPRGVTVSVSTAAAFVAGVRGTQLAMELDAPAAKREFLREMGEMWDRCQPSVVIALLRYVSEGEVVS